MLSNNQHAASPQPPVVPADLDLGAVRAFVAVSEDRYFGEAAARLGITQQAISKRIAKLESDLELRLFFRSRNGADLTEDGRAFLPHARALIGIADQAWEGMRRRRRALRVDVLDTRLASIDLIRAFHESTTTPHTSPHRTTTTGPNTPPHGATTTGPDTSPHGATTTGPDTSPHGATTTGPDTSPHGATTTGPDTSPHGGTTAGPSTSPTTATADALPHGTTVRPDAPIHRATTSRPDAPPHGAATAGGAMSPHGTTARPDALPPGATTPGTNVRPREAATPGADMSPRGAATAGVDVEIITSNGFRSARTSLTRGSVDAAFCRVSGTLEEDLCVIPAYLEPLHLLLNRHHPLATQSNVRMAQLSGTTVWMPGNTAGSEWAEYYDLLAAAFNIEIDTSGPDFGWEHFVEQVGSGRRVSFVGERTRVPWHPNTIQIPLVDPSPVYPFLLLHHRQNRHPMLEALTAYITSNYQPFAPERQWLPAPDRSSFPSR